MRAPACDSSMPSSVAVRDGAARRLRLFLAA
jgi:hypothetical protein